MDLGLVLVLFQVVVLLFSFGVHESVHAWAALRLGMGLSAVAAGVQFVVAGAVV